MSTRVAVVGLGLIGGSIAAALRGAGYEVAGFDRNGEHAATAKERGLVDRAPDELGESLAGAEVVVLAVPPRDVIPLIDEADRLAPTAGLVVDTASVKLPVVEAMSRVRGSQRFVGGHPIAGTERSGPDAADPDLLVGKTFVLCPHDRTESDALHRATRVAHDMEMRVQVMPAEEHDRILAASSHLPQLLSTALALSSAGEARELAGPAWREMTRLARSQPDIWEDIFVLNRTNMQAAIERFRTALDRLAADIDACDRAAVRESMQRAARLLDGES